MNCNCTIYYNLFRAIFDIRQKRISDLKLMYPNLLNTQVIIKDF